MTTSTATDYTQLYRSDLPKDTLIDLYKRMLLPRLIEEKMLILLRQGKISKWFAGIGQEAIAAGVTAAMQKDEYILPMHRNLGVFTGRDIPLWKLFAQWQGKQTGFTKGRDRSFHFGTQEYNIVGMISHLGPQMGVADGIALAQKLKGTGKATAVFTGEGGTSEGDFHEALNVASVWELPVLFCIENNGYGLSTPTSEQYNCKDLAERGVGYGIESHIIDGNNIIEVYTQIDALLQRIRKEQKPILIEFKTFRRRGHEEASGTKYVPEDLMQYWEERDPLTRYEAYLLAEGVMSTEDVATYIETYKKQINEELQVAYAEELPVADTANELQDLYAPHQFVPKAKTEVTKNIRLVDAIREGLHEAMKANEDLVIMGQDVAEYGGVFKITDGFVDDFGRDRVRNTPICESAIVEAGMGLSIAGMKAVVEMQFADFVSSGFNPIVNYLAKSHYRWAQKADVVVRMPCGGGVGAGPFHSQTNESWFFTTPGLKIVYPAFPADAKGLLITAIEDPNPVLYFEHKGLYRSITEEVPEGYYNLPFGQAAHVKEGDKLSIITYGLGVHWAMDIAKEEQMDVDIIDLRTLAPLDYESIRKSVMKTSKVLVLCEDSATGSVAKDIAAWISEHCFELLDAPVLTLGSLDTPIPFEPGLEENYLAKKQLKNKLNYLLTY